MGQRIRGVGSVGALLVGCLACASSKDSESVHSRIDVIGGQSGASQGASSTAGSGSSGATGTVVGAGGAGAASIAVSAGSADSADSAGSAGNVGSAGNAGGAGSEGTEGSVGAAGGRTETVGNAAPYANVTAVSVTGSAGSYTFGVSVESADIDCSQYANWWEVLGEDGSLLYRRILDHPHTDENGTTDSDAPGNTFTRTGGPVDVDADAVVIVRAHMNHGGYNGMTMRGTPAAGFVTAPDIGATFAASVETASPQPTTCQEV